MSSPQSIAHYRIVSKLGEGGMGAVYRATDTKLNRDVAIKVLPDAFAADSGRMQRFEREAQVLASLNHPNIAQIYGVEQGAIVMELVEGPDLAVPLPLDTALDYARQIAAGLEAAHEKGVVHRDLKPANIKVTPAGTVKILDFGLAKTDELSRNSSTASPTLAPTLSLAVTQPGMIVGTAAYMSPEQARGQATDKRADIWAFGVVLYEMITGRRPFQGEDLSHTMAAVIMQEPAFDGIPASLHRLLKACLEKDPKKRLRDIGDVWRLLGKEPAAGEPAPPARSWTAWIGWAVAAAAVAVAVGLAFFREPPPEVPVTRFEIAFPEQVGKNVTGASISPDGRRIVAVENELGTGNRLIVRSLDSLETRVLPGTESGSLPFWSADSRSIAFQALGKLRVVEYQGGPSQAIAEVAQFRGGTWNAAGDILFVQRGGLWLIRNGRGAPSQILEGQVTGPQVPGFLPDGRHFVVTALNGDGGIFLGSIEANDPEGKRPRRLVSDFAKGMVTPLGPAGSLALLFVRDTTLMAVPLNRSLEPAKDAYPVAERVARRGSNVGDQFSSSLNGNLVYQTQDGERSKLTWYDRQGKELGTVGEPGDYQSLSLSPDGTQVVVDKQDNQYNSDIWLYDLVRNSKIRITSDPATDTHPLWSPDGKWVVFNSMRDNAQGVYRKAANGTGPEELLGKAPVLHLYDWSPDGKNLLVATTSSAQSSRDLYTLAVEGDHKPTPLVKTQFRDDQGRFSPDGKFIAYKSNETGHDEIYVQPTVPGTTERWAISQGRGTMPRWSRDGKQLYYMARSTVMVADVQTAPTFRAGIPKALFSTKILGAGGNAYVTWDMTPDSQRFLMVTEESSAPTPLTVVLNWPAGLRNKAVRAE